MKTFAALEREMELMKSAFGDKQKFPMLISEYRQFISKKVKHVRLNQAANSNAYIESSFKPFQISLIQLMKTFDHHQERRLPLLP